MRFTLPRYRSTIGSVGIAFDTDEIRLLQLRDAKLIGHGVHLRLIAPAYSHEIGVRMGLMDGDEFSPEPEADDGDVELLVAHEWRKVKSRK